VVHRTHQLVPRRPYGTDRTIVGVDDGDQIKWEFRDVRLALRAEVSMGRYFDETRDVREPRVFLIADVGEERAVVLAFDAQQAQGLGAELMRMARGAPGTT
jgi:hypothetical protein